MRRFLLTVFLSATVVFLLTEYRENHISPRANNRAAPPSALAAKVEPKASSSSIPELVQRPIAAAPAVKEPAIELPVQADAVDYAASHTTSSAPAKAAEEELAKLSSFDLKSAVQRELDRLGCYEARIDGRWGRKSQAAVKAFNERSGTNLSAKPSPKLAKALRAAPDGICKSDCQGAACTVASLKTNSGSGKNAAGPSYLPPSMGEARLASADPKAAPAAVATAAPAVKKAAKSRDRRKTVKARQGSRKAEPRAYRSAESWGPDNWPSTGR
jgi:hypothetical protein